MKTTTKSFLWLMAALMMVLAMAIRTFSAQMETLKKADRNIKEGRMIVLNGDTSPEAMASLLLSRHYIDDQEEALFVSKNIISAISSDGGSLTGIRDLGYRKYGIVLDSVGCSRISKYPGLSLKAKETQSLLQSIDIAKSPVPTPALSRKYNVRIKEEGTFGKTVCDTVYICAREHWNDPVFKDGKVVDCQSRDSVYAWIPVCGKSSVWLPKTDDDGKARYFSLLPVAEGYSFGTAKGTLKNTWGKIVFTRRPAVLSLLGDGTLKRMREDNTIAVRTVQEYKEKYIATFALFIAIWMLAFLLLVAIDRKRGGHSELGLLAFAALLSGMGLVTLFNVQNPMWGRFYAWAQLEKGMVPGLILMLLFAFIDWTGIYKFSYREHASRGSIGVQGMWLVLTALMLLVILMLFGSGPGGTRINLPLTGIGASPIIKLLVLSFFAVIFASRKELIEAYSSSEKFGKQILVTVTVMIALLVIGVMQLIISDLGPFLIIVFTGLFLYSLMVRQTVPMLIGAAFFLIMLFVGTHVFKGGKSIPFVIFTMWAVGWVAYGYGKQKRVNGTALFLSLTLLLTFHGGTLLEIIGFSDVAERLNGRTEMAAHVFDNEVRGGSQIAEAIWAMTRGGLSGTPGTGLASTMPAGFTDLAGMSLVENLGFVGFIIMIVAIGLLIFFAIRVGIRSGHPFAFALCSALALSMGLQTCMITFGNLGIIPLSGVCLPFISYGGTSLAIELASIGMIVGLSRNPDVKLERINTRRYAAMSWAQVTAFILLSLIAVGTVFNYAIVSRDKYMVKLCLTVNKEGQRIIVNNPLIDATVEKLIPGDILDKNGIVLASTKEDGTRQYPYGNKLLLMVGDANTKVLWGSTGRYPAGVLAEESFRHQIRGYDTKEVKLEVSSRKHYSPFLPSIAMDKKEVVTLEDFSGLIPMMKSPRRIEEWNAHKNDRNITLTVDAELQSALQERMASFIREMQRIGKATERTRGVVVIEDAAEASLLTSSVFPLPNPQILRERAEAHAYIYKDWTPGFRAFSDMDLSLVPLAPGSVIKIISAGAGLRRFSVALTSEQYNQYVYAPEIVDISLGEPIGPVSLKQAIVQSSNIYFIKLVNRYGEYGLYPELEPLYYAVGVTFDGMTPYVLYPDKTIVGEEMYSKRLMDFGETAASKYAAYEVSGQYHRLIDAEYQPTWGQGKLAMSPLALCRYVGAVAQNGTMMYPRYVASDPIVEYRQLLSPDEARVLQSCMKAQAEGRFGNFSSHIFGKTGTPNRVDKSKRSGKSNDALYCFYVDAEGTTNGHPLAVVVRLERVNDYSRLAMQMTREVVLPVLREKGYIL